MINTPYKTYQPTPQYDRAPIYPGLQLLIFIGLLFVALIAGIIIAMVIIDLVYGSKTLTGAINLDATTPNFANSMWILQFFSTTLPILAVPVFFAYVIAHDPQAYLKAGFNFRWALMIIVFTIMFISSPIIEYLSNLNQKIPIPHFLKWMQDDEVREEKVMAVMLQMKTIWGLLFNVMFIGLLTAVVEELMFRGCLQTIFARWTKNIHVAIWITAILFSAFHMDFDGFFPRVFLGALFGYFVAWSGSVWTSVWAHFINNSTVVVVTYLFQKKLIKISPDDNHVFTNFGYISSLIIVLFLFWVYHYIATNRKPVVA